MTSAFIHPLTGFIEKTFVITGFELRKLRHDFTELVTRALQPALWLLIFGQVFSRSGMMPTGNIPYLDFIAPGILAQSVLFVAAEVTRLISLWGKKSIQSLLKSAATSLTGDQTKPYDRHLHASADQLHREDLRDHRI